MVGGKTEITFDHIYEKDGQVFFSSGGIYKIPLAGGNATLIANDIGAEKIISVQDGYVYYVWFPSSGTWGGALAELHRVPVDGGTPEVVYRTQPGRYLAAFDGITTVYLEEWIWNDQYKFLMIDIATGKEVHLLSGTFRFLGVNRDAVFIDDMNGRVSRIPKDGGTATNNLNVPYPLTLDPYWINAGVEDFYFSISYLDDAQGYVSEIDLLKRLQ
jgi:hypothetical protein